MTKATNFKNLKWIFFDLDDTLWSFSANSAVALRRLYDLTPLLQQLYPDYSAFDEIYHQRNAELWQQYHRGEINREYLIVERFRYPLVNAECFANAEYGMQNSELQSAGLDAYALSLNDKYLDLLPDRTETMPYAIEVLKALAPHYLIGGLSNGFNHTQYRKILGSGLYRYIQRMVVSDEIGIQKPDRRIFDYALRETGATAETALMVGDNPEADVLGALNAGWRAVFYNPNDKTPLHTPDQALTITDLRELLPLLL